MKLSILDQSPISSNQTARDALYESMRLAQRGESLGYTRYWIAEHHNLSGLACSAPEVMLGFIGANTDTIRIGPGAVLLPHYKPYKVAEIYHMLATLFPGRIDVGIGRAPGGSAEATNALSDHFLQNVWKMPDLVKDLLLFLDNQISDDHDFSKLTAAPLPEVSPVPWLLGTSKKSAKLAAENGLAYVFGQFMSDQNGVDIVKQYRNDFKPRKEGDTPEVIVTVSAICAETTEKAEEVAQSWLVWQLQKEKGEGTAGIPSPAEAKEYMLIAKDGEKMEKMKQKIVIGNPREVKSKLEQVQADYQADEIMIVSITHSPEEKHQSYQLIAEQLL